MSGAVVPAGIGFDARPSPVLPGGGAPTYARGRVVRGRARGGCCLLLPLVGGPERPRRRGTLARAGASRSALGESHRAGGVPPMSSPGRERRAGAGAAHNTRQHDSSKGSNTGPICSSMLPETAVSGATGPLGEGGAVAFQFARARDPGGTEGAVRWIEGRTSGALMPRQHMPCGGQGIGHRGAWSWAWIGGGRVVGGALPQGSGAVRRKVRMRRVRPLVR